MTRGTTTLARILGVLLATLVLFGTPGVFADGDPATDGVPRVMPYQGFLNLNGKPLNAYGGGAIWMKFALYDGIAATQTAYEQVLEVEVFAGRFSVLLGPAGEGGVDLAPVIAAADELYLGITLLNDPVDPADDVELSGRQLVTPAPYALWSAHASDLQVANDLAVGGALTVNGTSQVADLNVNNDLVVTGTTTTGTTSAGNTSITGDDNDGIVAALMVSSGGPQMLIDTNEIDTTDSWGLLLNYNSNAPIRLYGLTYLLRANHPPEVCDSTVVGAIYMDGDQGGFQIPCVCMRLTTGSYKWAPFDNWNAACD